MVLQLVWPLYGLAQKVLGHWEHKKRLPTSSSCLSFAHGSYQCCYCSFKRSHDLAIEHWPGCWSHRAGPLDVPPASRPPGDRCAATRSWCPCCVSSCAGQPACPHCYPPCGNRTANSACLETSPCQASTRYKWYRGWREIYYRQKTNRTHVSPFIIDK